MSAQVQPPKRRGVTRKQALRINNPCGAFVKVARSSAMGSVGHYHIRSMDLGHSHCTSSATPKMAGIAEHSSFRSFVASQRGANVHALGDSLKKDHVVASKQMIWRAKVGRCRLDPRLTPG